MAYDLLACGECSAPLPPEAAVSVRPIRCGGCGAEQRLASFPAAAPEALRGAAPAPLIDDSASSCYLHPRNRAEDSCQRCGRFLCAFCNISMAGQQLCASCIESGLGAPHLRTEFVRYDKMALTVASLPFLVLTVSFLLFLPAGAEVGIGVGVTFFLLLSIFSAPIALYLVIAFRKEPLSPLPGLRWRTWLGALVALLAIAACALFVAAIIVGASMTYAT